MSHATQFWVISGTIFTGHIAQPTVESEWVEHTEIVSVSVGEFDETDDGRDAKVDGPPRVRFLVGTSTTVHEHLVVWLAASVDR